MTEIEKMYKNAGIEGEWRDYRVKNGKVYNGKNPKNRNIRLCRPCFTSAKQLELIKWCLFKYKYINYLDIENYANKISIQETQFVSDDCDTLEEAIASFINNMWKYLTDTEKAEIKEILNDK